VELLGAMCLFFTNIGITAKDVGIKAGGGGPGRPVVPSNTST